MEKRVSFTWQSASMPTVGREARASRARLPQGRRSLVHVSVSVDARVVARGNPGKQSGCTIGQECKSVGRCRSFRLDARSVVPLLVLHRRPSPLSPPPRATSTTAPFIRRDVPADAPSLFISRRTSLEDSLPEGKVEPFVSRPPRWARTPASRKLRLYPPVGQHLYR